MEEEYQIQSDLNIEAVRYSVQRAFEKGLAEAERTGSKTVILDLTPPYVQFIEWGSKKK